MKKIITAASAALIIWIAGALSLSAAGGLDFSVFSEECGEALRLVLLTAYRMEEEAASEPVENNNYVEGTRHAKAIPDIDEEDRTTDPFFENSVFAGDSLMEGFRLYCLYKGNNFLSSPFFLAETSLSLRQLLTPVTALSKHPYYMGEKMLLEDAIAKSGAARAFLHFGTNDMVGLTPEETLEEYNNLIYRIHEKAPEVKIYVIGLTYIYSSGQKPGFTNENMRKFNDAMYKYCQNYDFLEFINIGDRLIGADDSLKGEYCSDGYIHMSKEGYKVWVKVLRAYAKDFSAD
ncbi:MAG: GDSL-type esterase/lipase family protein [Clostridiales bacterium]|nr:GDSL-type esterase/lipase family protein [Clostridiales bacterium]